MSVTLRTVAKNAGVSASTVSRVLRGQGGVSTITTERVLRVAQDLGYKPRKYERKQSVLQAKNVCVLSSRTHNLLNNAFYSQIVSGIEGMLSKHRCQLVYRTFTGQDADDLSIIDSLIQSQDGVIIVGYDIDPALIDRISRHKLPLVLVDNDGLHMNIDCIVNDNLPAAKRMVQHLIALGHQRIAFIGGPAHHSSLTDRYQGYLQALAEAGLPVDPRLVTFCTPRFRIDDGHRATEALLNKASPRPTALFAANDGLAIGAIRAALAMGLKVPEDLSVAGFDDIDASPLITPGLTTVRVHKYDMGVEAVNRLIQIVQGAVNKPLKIVLPTELVIRESTAKP